MKAFGKLGLMIGSAVLCTCLGSDAHAQMGMNGGFGLGYGFFGGGPYNNQYDVGPLPYYSLYPPVYYSQPVPRTYGYSPFAYPPGYLTPEVEWVQPKVLRNPHVPENNVPRKSATQSAPRSTPPADRTTAIPMPKVIVNPYVESSVAWSAAAVRRPLVVKPSLGALVDNTLVDNAQHGQ